jgi:hypothetical protein
MGKDKSKARAQREARLAKAAEEDAKLDAEDTAIDDATEASREEQAAQVEAVAAMTRIQIDVAVNGLPSGQRLTVPIDHPFYAGLIDQKLAHVIEEDED